MTLFKMVDAVFEIAGTVCAIGVFWYSVKIMGKNATSNDRFIYRQLMSGLFAAMCAHAICELAIKPDIQQRITYAILPLITLAAVWIAHFVDLAKSAKGLPVV